MISRIAVFVGSLGACVVTLLFVVGGSAAAQSVSVDVTARVAAKSTDVCVPTSAAVAVPTTALVGRRGLNVQNNGPNPLNCAPDPTVLTTAAPMGHVIPGGINASWSVPVGEKIVIRCVALVAGQAAATGCTNVHEVK